MTQWCIDPGGVVGVVSLVSRLQGELAESLVPGVFEVVVSGVSWGGEYTAAVSQALAGLLVDQQDELETIVHRVQAGVLGTLNAVAAYQAGQAEMSASFQGQMFAAAESGDVSYFQQHGYLGGAGS